MRCCLAGRDASYGTPHILMILKNLYKYEKILDFERIVTLPLMGFVEGGMWKAG